MEKQSKVFGLVVLGVGAAVAALLLQPAVEERLAPKLRLAWVAIEAEGRGVAEVGPVEMVAGTPFALYAVVEAESRDGEPVYYTEATSLRLHGEEIPAEQIRRWDRDRRIQIRWYTVEGTPQMLEVATEEDAASLENFAQEILFRPDWPFAWKIPGKIVGTNNGFKSVPVQPTFGTQRYHVQVELYGIDDDALLPESRIRSWAAAEALAQPELFPTARVILPGALGPASWVFGLSQIERGAEAPTELAAQVTERVEELAEQGLAFSRALLIRDLLSPAGRRYEDLEWRVLDLAGEGRWGEPSTPEAIAPGDLLRVGDRLVVLFEDQGEPGVLDYGDLCFDFVRGAAVRRLDQVFAGSGEAVEVASLD